MEKTMNYAMMLIGLSLGIMTMLPEFGISFGFDFAGFIFKAGALALIILSFVKQMSVWKAEGSMPMPFVVLTGISATMLLITMFFDIFGIFGWIGFITGIIAAIFAGKAFNANISTATGAAITLAAATTAALYEVNNDDAIFVNIAAIVAYVFIMKGVKAINSKALGLLKIAAILGIVASVLYLIKVAFVVAWIPYLVFAVMLFIAYLGFKKEVAAGGTLLMVAGIVLLVEEVFDFIPAVDVIICPILLIAVIALNILGWIKVIGDMAKA